MRRKKIYLLLIFVFIPVFLAGFLGWYSFFTTRGSSLVTELVLSEYTDSGHISVSQVRGTLSQKLTYEDFTLENPGFLPPGSSLKIKRLDIQITSLGLEGLSVQVHNGRLLLPGSEPVLFYGSLAEGVLNFNLYAKKVTLREINQYLPENKVLRKLTGTGSDIDVDVTGTVMEPELKGKFKIDRLAHNGFSLSDCPGTLDLRLKDPGQKPELYGTVTAERGVISGSNTAVVNLGKSRIMFDADPQKPSFDLQGSSTVEKTKIKIVLKGTLDKPDLKLSSEPPRSQEHLLVMLATGKSWKGSEGLASKGQISADLAGDFMDYFVFGGAGSRLAQRLGITDFSLTLAKDKTGVSVTKNLSENVNGTYSVQQTQDKEGQAKTTHKVGGEYQITENVSLGAEKDISPSNKTNGDTGQQKEDSKVLLKFKKEF